MIITFVPWISLAVMAGLYARECWRAYERRPKSMPDQLARLTSGVKTLQDDVLLPAISVLEDIMGELCDLRREWEWHE